MKDIPVTRGRRLITSLVAEGEHVRQDFKYTISDARKIARSISAFANAEGGRLLIGVKDNGVIAGVRNEEDVYVVELAGSRYCDPPQQIDFHAYSIDTGVTVIVAGIAKADSRPVRCQEPDGRWNAYYRVADENILAHPLMVRSWMNRDGLAFSLNAESSALLDLLSRHPEGLDTRDIAVALQMSHRRAADLITGLAAAGVVTFTYLSPSFRITLPKEE